LSILGGQRLAYPGSLDLQKALVVEGYQFAPNYRAGVAFSAKNPTDFG
jgi:hypothetical protein